MYARHMLTRISYKDLGMIYDLPPSLSPIVARSRAIRRRVASKAKGKTKEDNEPSSSLDDGEEQEF